MEAEWTRRVVALAGTCLNRLDDNVTGDQNITHTIQSSSSSSPPLSAALTVEVTKSVGVVVMG